jgi:hypothetical protein
MNVGRESPLRLRDAFIEVSRALARLSEESSRYAAGVAIKCMVERLSLQNTVVRREYPGPQGLSFGIIFMYRFRVNVESRSV